MQKKIADKLQLGIIYRRSNKWWNIPYLTEKLSKFANLQITTFEVSEYDSIEITSNIHALALLPSESDLVPSLLNANSEIKWIHSMFAGVDKFLNYSEIKNNKNITLTNSKGAFAESLSEFALFSMLYYSYNAPDFVSAYSKKNWIRPINTMLKDKRLLIVGYGMNGTSLAQKAKSGFGLKVFGMRKNPKNQAGSEHVEAVIPISDFDKFTTDADFLVSFLPHTPETINFFNFEKLSRMKNTSVFINLGRGSSVVEEDLIKVLKERRIRGAVLDVTQIEPLPANSPLYELDNLFLSCHAADNTDDYFNQAVEVFEKNLEMYFSEGKFYSPVDKVKGY